MSVRARILVALSGGDAMSSREIAAKSGLARLQVDNCIWRCWRQGYVLRTAEAVHVVETVHRHYLKLLDYLRLESKRLELPVRTIEKALFKKNLDQ